VTSEADFDVSSGRQVHAGQTGRQRGGIVGDDEIARAKQRRQIAMRAMVDRPAASMTSRRVSLV
jgi:hypothetical protein